MNKIIVIFKTHLDLGFTELAEQVTKRYLTEYIPNALKVARELRGEEERFVWSTGSWLIQKYLELGKEPKLLEDAIRHGEIRWHGLPFTTHTELMDQELFHYGLSISKGLDQRFGFTTTAAKLTDVPGHTRAIIPQLAKAGIRFLHIGVNPASTRPEVPNLFRWRGDGGEELVVMYNNDYGELTEIGTTGAAVYFAHTGDNRGPQSSQKIREIYQQLHKRYPEAELVAGTLEDVAKLALTEELPVITEEIGDTWIHGGATDPRKISQYRALLRLKNQLPPEEMQLLYKELLPVPEHTWGLDEKITLGTILETGEPLGEHGYFVRTEFEQAKSTEAFRRMEQSWAEQRTYVSNAVGRLSGQSRALAELVVSEYKREPELLDGFLEKEVGEAFQIGSYQIRVNHRGEIDFFTKGGQVLADQEHPLGSFCYEVFSQKEYDRFREQYVVSEESWALEDFGKIGVEKAVKEYHCYEPEDVKVWAKGQIVVIRWSLSREATDLYGGVELGELKVELGETEVYFDFAWFGKKASRIPEGLWLSFRPRARITELLKMGAVVRPLEVVSGGNRRMHAVGQVNFEGMTLETLDAPVISLGEPGLVNFTRELPSLTKGVYVSLFNNTWGTNFPMWYEEDARFRFRLRLHGINDDVKMEERE